MKTTYELEPGDIEYITAPASPCDKCRMGGACCGCPEQSEWAENYGNEIKRRGLEEWHALWKQYYRLEIEAKKAVLASESFKAQHADELKVIERMWNIRWNI